MERKALIGTGVVVLVAVVALVVVAVTYEPGVRTSYDYRIDDVYYREETGGYYAEISFFPDLESGVKVSVIYNGENIGSYTVREDGLDSLTIRLYRYPDNASLASVLYDSTVEFSVAD